MKITIKYIALILSALIILTGCGQAGFDESTNIDSHANISSTQSESQNTEAIHDTDNSSTEKSETEKTDTEKTEASIGSESEETEGNSDKTDTSCQETFGTEADTSRNDIEDTSSVTDKDETESDADKDGDKESCSSSDGKHTDINNDGDCDSCGISVIVIIDFYVINDLHGKFDDTSNNIGVDELTTYLKNAKKTDDNVILLSSGDMWQGSSESNLTKGLIITDWMSELDFVSMTIGNHEYDWGEELIELNADAADFPFLAINIYDRATNQRVEYCQPSIIVERDGLQIGIIGAVGDCYSSIASDKCEDVYFKVGSQLTELIKAESEKLRAQGADFIVYSIHDGYGSSSSTAGSITASKLSAYYDVSLSNGYVDLVFEGHSHQSYVLQDQYGVYHLQGGGDNKGISHVEISINFANDNSKVNTAEFVSNSKYSSLTDDPLVDQLLEKYADEIAKAKENLGKNARLRNSDEIMDLVAQLYYEKGVEVWGDQYRIALGGGFLKARSPYKIQAGDVKYSDIQSVLPFDNQIVLCSVKGKYLKSKFFETSNSDYHIAYGDYGASIKGSINANATYYIIVDSYTATYAPNNLTIVDTLDGDIFARDLLADYIKEGGWS